MIGLDWIAFNVERAIGVRRASPAEAALGSQLELELLAELPVHVQRTLQVHNFLDCVR